MAEIRGLEIARPGEYQLSTGPLTLTPEMLADAVRQATAAGANFRAPVKLGHVDPRFDGEPALGWLHNLRVEGSGADSVLLGDVSDMPDWLAKLGPSAYPDRSFEGWVNEEKQTFEVTALALLGVTPPGMSTIRSLRDIPQALGVAATRVPVAASFTAAHDAVTVQPGGGTITVPAGTTHLTILPAGGGGGGAVAASAVSDKPWAQFSDADYSDEQYARACLLDRGMGAGTAKQRYSLRVREPDGTLNRAGCHAAASVLAGGRGGVNASPQAKKAAAVKLVGLYRNQLKEDPPPSLLSAAGMAAASGPDAPAPTGDGPTEGSPAVPLTDEQLTKARRRLGLAADADEAAVMAALTADPPTPDPTEPADPADPATPTNPADPTAPPPAPASIAASSAAAGVGVFVDAETLARIQAQATKGEEAYRVMAARERDQVIEAAVHDGKIPRSRMAHWVTYWKSDPDGAKAALAAMPKNLVPVAASGYAGGLDDDGADDEFADLFPPTQKVSG